MARDLRDRQAHIFAAITEPAPLSAWLAPSPRAPEPEPRSPLRILLLALGSVCLVVLIGLVYGWRA